MKNEKLSRRGILKTSLGVAGILAAGPAIAQGVAEMCGQTPKQPEGPFYPKEEQLDKDNDLTQVVGSKTKALGQIIYIKGKVTDQLCNPIKGALVDIWQACHSGKYNHSGDPNPAPLDSNFQYWGMAITNDQGEYLFKTVLPGAYPASDDWVRPSHIHYKVSKRGFQGVTTQLYFEGDPFNESDKILQQLSKEEQAQVITKLEKPIEGFDPLSKVGVFNISLKKL